MIRESFDNGLGIDEAVNTVDWPFPAAKMLEAVGRGYDALRRS